MSSPTGSSQDRSAPEEERTVRRADLRSGRPDPGTSRPGRGRARPSLRLPAVRLPHLAGFGGLTVPGVPEGVTTRVRGLRERTRPAWSPVAGFLGWISPLGWSVVTLGVAAWVVGRWAGWTEWLMIGAAALVLVLCCVLLAIGRTRVTVTTDLEPVRVSVGEPATGRITVTNDSKRGMLPLLVELPVGVSAARFTLPPLGSGKAHEELFGVPTHRRGVIPVGPARTVQGDPLGLVRRTERWTDVTDLYVHPRTVSLESLGAGLLRDLEGETTQDLSMSDLAFHALREYQPGDDRRYIHWRSSAKAGRLLVRQFLDTRRSHLCLVVDADPEQFQGGEDEAETAISAAASLALRAIRDEQDTTVVCRDQVASRTTASLTLDALARAELGSCDVFGRCTEAFSLAPDTSVVILVTGPQRPFIEAQRALAQFELEVKKVVLTVDAMQETGIQHLGGLTRLNIRRIQDLRAVLASGALV